MSSAPSGTVRRPAVAGLFYPAQEQECIRVAEDFVRAGVSGANGSTAGAPDATETARQAASSAGGPWIGAIVPHAGWICSGAIAGEAIGTMSRSHGGRKGVGSAGDAGAVDVVVIFAAVHTPLPLRAAALASHGAWAAPGGTSRVPGELSQKLLRDAGSWFVTDDRFHDREHAVEVELPLVQRALPGARVLPIEVPLTEEAVQIGTRVADAVRSENLRAVYLASSDLTHYGPAYGFAPAGIGADALAWARENDRRLLRVVTELSAERVVPEVRKNLNACGGGAIAAMLSACREQGAQRASVLRHANSYEVLRDVAPQRPDNAVGYAAVVVG